MRHGQGKMAWDDGEKYEVEYRHDKMHGHGKYTWADGDSYEG